MRLLEIRHVKTMLPGDPIVEVLSVRFSASGIQAGMNLALPDGWDGWTRQAKVTWVKQAVADHLASNAYKEPDAVVFPDRALPDSAKDGYESLPGWADWTAGQASQWIEDNVTNLATTKTVMKAMAKALCYLRDVTIER